MRFSKKVIIALDLYFILLFGYMLLHEYIESIQQREPESMHSGDGVPRVFLTIVALMVIVGLISVSQQVSVGRFAERRALKGVMTYVVGPATIFYAAFCAFSGTAGMFFIIIKSISHFSLNTYFVNRSAFSEVIAYLLLLLVHFIGLASIGILAVYDIRKRTSISFH